MLCCVPQQDTELWKELRKSFNGISASNLGSILGFGSKSRNEEWKYYKKIKEREDVSFIYACRRGHENEPKAAKKFSNKIKKTLYSTGSFIHRRYPLLLASPDRVFFENLNFGEGAVIVGLEIKNPISREVPDDVNSLTSLYLDAICQAIMNMEILDSPWWYIMINNEDSGEYSIFKIYRNHEFFEKNIIPYLFDFLIRRVEYPRDNPAEKKQRKLTLINSHRIDLVDYNRPFININLSQALGE